MTNDHVKISMMRFVREHCIKFLYQCEAEKIYYFSSTHLQPYLANFHVDSGLQKKLAAYCSGVFDKRHELDLLVDQYSSNWSLTRMASTDRAVLRLAIYELLYCKIPYKVVLNEAIELAKIYGTEHSFKFVNGILDGLTQKLDVESK